MEFFELCEDKMMYNLVSFVLNKFLVFCLVFYIYSRFIYDLICLFDLFCGFKIF